MMVGLVLMKIDFGAMAKHEEIDSKMDNALSGYISINESADSSNGLFTEEEQEDRETDIRMLPTLTSKLKNNNK